ncbi:endo-1,4-D-glucanase [Pandoraea terrae]|uniref:cellulase n=1 Tax=Pandoraea terrae TaxID=1537710 RepID=A0A5E4RXF0_9BURK|nr:cellulose synthase complex periplasmic endoglucanase BcsZ [Pandoraea terrae]VVD68210.1 endo-1,4-D-glucanase [Pandoraea terrae]
MDGRTTGTGNRRRALLRAFGACAATFGALGGLNSAGAAPSTRKGAVPGVPPDANASVSPHCPGDDWPAWHQFKTRFLSADGRVMDRSMEDQRTVSEGQAYGLFFSLVANDRATFDKLLAWTESNLAQGDLIAHLPAWLWGRKTDGQWGVIDGNPASDADLWMAYVFAEAGRLWRVRRYAALGALLARRILAQETDFVPGLGRTLLPAPAGFHPAADQWRLNPSYVPMQVVRRLAGLFPDSGWPGLINSSLQQIVDPSSGGFAPEWTLYRAGHGFQLDPQTQAEGSYNAIRVYLWAGMLAPESPDTQVLSRKFEGMLRYVAQHGAPPERVDIRNGTASRDGPAGFSAALLPLLQSTGNAEGARAQEARVRALDAQSEPGYYSAALSLFGLGWQAGRFRFAADGALQLPWEAVCATR